MERLLLLLLLSLCSAASAEEVDAPEKVKVTLKQGVISGQRSTAVNGKVFYSFKTIPFAEPPVGELRFKDPVPAGPWTGERDGSIPTPFCPQYFAINQPVYGQEDCLFLSVYTPRPNISDLPVMVFIHGGGYIQGLADQFGPHRILSKDVVLVVMQYRLSTLGFLSTEDSELPGNQGMKDQVMALQWVKDNIHDLGGDPQKVTLFGSNTGAVNVYQHILSPMSKGLFQRAILQSVMGPWMTSKGHREVAIKIGQMFNCTDVESKALVSCLREVPFKELVAAEAKFLKWRNIPLTMAPRVDGQFLPEDPEIMTLKGRYNKVPLVMGTTRDEGSLFLRLILTQPDLMEKLFKNFDTLGPLLMGNEISADIARRVFYRYMEKLDFTMDKIPNFVQLFSDMWSIMTPMLAELHGRDASFNIPVYLYEFQHRGQYGMADPFFGPTPEWDMNYVGHGDDLQYLFTAFMMNKTLARDDDLFVSRIMVDLWTNFAATGNPTPDMSLGFKWQPTAGPELRYLGITTNPTMEDYDDYETLNFYKNLPWHNNN